MMSLGERRAQGLATREHDGGDGGLEKQQSAYTVKHACAVAARRRKEWSRRDPLTSRRVVQPRDVNAVYVLHAGSSRGGVGACDAISGSI